MRAPRTSIAIAQIEPQDAIVAKNAADLAEQLHHAVDIVVRRLLQPHLAISPIVAQAIIGRAGYAALDRAAGNIAQTLARIAQHHFARHGRAPPAAPARTPSSNRIPTQ